MWHPPKLALGAVICVGFIVYYVALETSCAKMSTRGDGGELVITAGGTADGTQAGTRFLAPRMAFSAEVPLNGTADAKLLRIELLCDAVLDCSSCPPQLRPTFNASVLDGALLITNPFFDARLELCGYNRLGRVLGSTGLAGIVDGSETSDSLARPGFVSRLFRLGEHRDALPHDSDGGIPFPFVSAGQYVFNPVLEALGNGAQMRAVLTPTAPNPWHSTMCGYWKPLRVGLMLGHVWVAERGASCFIGHAQSAGVRFDLAQTASATEVVAHLLFALSLHDPFISFQWGLLPHGIFAAVLIGPLVLGCSSTLLLAGFW